MIVGLSRATLTALELLAVERNGVKQVSRKHDDKRDEVAVGLHGLAGEYATCLALGIPFDARHFAGGDRNDGVLPDGRTVEIKTRDQPGRDFALQSDNPRDFKGDVGIVAWPVYKHDYSVIELGGWIAREEFLDQCHVANYQRKPGAERLAVLASQLHPMDTLIGPN